MKQFLLKALVFLLPFAAGLGYVEYRLSGMNTNYRNKRERLERHLPTLKVLVLGSSNAYYGINPHYFDQEGFSLAYRNQSPYYDAQQVLRYAGRMPELKVVLIPVIYFTMGTRVEETEPWRTRFYEQFWRIPAPGRSGWSVWLEPERFSKIALFGDRTPGIIKGAFSEKLDDESEENGWFDSGTKACDLGLNIGPDGAKAHNVSVKVENIRLNLEYMQAMVTRLKQAGVVPVLVQLPVLPAYSAHVDEKFAVMQSLVKEFAATNGISHFDYFKDARFTLQDFTDMPDHLNGVGAAKFSRIVNEEILRPVFNAPQAATPAAAPRRAAAEPKLQRPLTAGGLGRTAPR